MTAPRACEKWMERVSAYADGECGLFERMLVRLHLGQCPRCREWLEQVRADEQTFRAAYLGDDEADNLTEAVMARVARESQARDRVAKRRVSSGQRLIEAMIAFGMLAILAAILFPVFARAREKARQSSCLSNMKQLALGTLSFAQDYDGRLPGALTWRDEVLPYVQNEQLFICPTDELKDVTYALNPLVAGRNLSDIEDQQGTVLLYEVDRSGQPVFPHNDGANYAFVDGHVKWYHRRDAPADLQATGFAPPEQSYGIAERLKLAYTASVDLIVENLEFVKPDLNNLKKGEDFKISILIKNIGQVDADEPFEIVLCRMEKVIKKTTLDTGLEAGKSYYWNFTLKNVKFSGESEWKVEIDPDGVINEDNKDNNVLIRPATIKSTKTPWREYWYVIPIVIVILIVVYVVYMKYTRGMWGYEPVMEWWNKRNA